MLRPLIPILLASAFTTTGSAGAKAQGILDTLELSGVLETELAIGTAAGDVQKADFVLTPEITLDLTPAMRLTVIGRLRGDIADDSEPGRPGQRNRSAISKRLFAGDHVDAELREAYIDTEIGSTFLRVGKQQVVWGQADGLKVLDVLNPQSFREFVLDDFEDSRIPLWISDVNYQAPFDDNMFEQRALRRGR